MRTIISVIIGVALLVGTFFLGRCTATLNEGIKSDTTQIKKIDTIAHSGPDPVRTDTVGHVTIPTRTEVKYVYLSSPTVVKYDTVEVVRYVTRSDARSDSMSFPIVQQTYKDSTFYAVVEGVEVYGRKPILKYHETYNTTITNTITNTDYKNHRFGVGIHAGLGVVITDPVRVAPYIGAGISYNFITF